MFAAFSSFLPLTDDEGDDVIVLSSDDNDDGDDGDDLGDGDDVIDISTDDNDDVNDDMIIISDDDDEGIYHYSSHAATFSG